MIHPEKADHRNVLDIIAPEPFESQYSFVASNDMSIMEAYIAITSEDAYAYPFGIYDDQVKEILDLILPYNPRVVIVYVEAPTLADNVERRKNQVSKKVIRRMCNSFEFPEFSEYDTLIVHQQQ